MQEVVQTYTLGQIVQTVMGYAQPALLVAVIAFGAWYYRSYAVDAFRGAKSLVTGVFSRTRRKTVSEDGVMTFEEASSCAKALAEYHKAHKCEEGYQAALKAGQCLFAEGKADAAAR